MAALFYPRYHAQQEPNFRSLFRMLDDFEQHSQTGSDGTQAGRQLQFFSPKFDLTEVESAYELHGELPGVDKNNVSIEFTDPQTIVVRGKVERLYTSSGGDDEAPEAGAQKQIAGGQDAPGTAPSTTAAAHKVTVEDEDKDNGKEVAAKTDSSQTQVQAKQPNKKAKYWVSERSAGQFSRTFHLPARGEQEGVTAGLENGVLKVTIPKARKHETKRIAIN